MNNTLLADAVGLVCLAALLFLTAIYFPDLQVLTIEWMFIYLIVAASALFVWHHRSAPKEPWTWLLCALCSVLAALAWVGYSRFGATLFFRNAEPNGSRAFDFAIAGMLSPGFTVVAAIGYVRALMLNKAPR